MNEDELIQWYRTIVLLAVNTLIQEYDFTEEEALEFSKKVANRLDNHILNFMLEQ